MLADLARRDGPRESSLRDRPCPRSASAGGRALGAHASLGLTFPVVDWKTAWAVVQARVAYVVVITYSGPTISI